MRDDPLPEPPDESEVGNADEINDPPVDEGTATNPKRGSEDRDFSRDDLDWGAFMEADESAVAEVVAAGNTIGSEQGDAIAIGELIRSTAETIFAAASKALSLGQTLTPVQLRTVTYPASVRLRFTLGEEALQYLDDLTSPSIEAAKHVRDLVAFSTDAPVLQGQLLELGEEVAKAYDRFLTTVAENDLEVVWRARNVEDAELTGGGAVFARDVLAQPIEEVENEPIRFVGKLTRADSDNARFGLRLQDRWRNRYKLTGKYDKEIEATIEEQNLWNHAVVAMVQVTWVRSAKAQTPEARFFLVDVGPADEAGSSAG